MCNKMMVTVLLNYLLKFMLTGGNKMYENNRKRKWNGSSKAIPLSLLDVKNELKKKAKAVPLPLKRLH